MHVDNATVFKAWEKDAILMILVVNCCQKNPNKLLLLHFFFYKETYLVSNKMQRFHKLHAVLASLSFAKF